MDIIGKLPKTANDYEYVIVTINYFTKWAEAVPLANIHDCEVIAFVWKHIIYRFSILKEIMVDNGELFNFRNFNTFYEKWNIKLQYSTPRYLKSNRKTESTNKTLISMLKKKVGRVKTTCNVRPPPPDDLRRGGRTLQIVLLHYILSQH